MCESMVDIQCQTFGIRRGNKKRRRKKNHMMKIYMSASCYARRPSTRTVMAHRLFEVSLIRPFTVKSLKTTKKGRKYAFSGRTNDSLKRCNFKDSRSGGRWCGSIFVNISGCSQLSSRLLRGCMRVWSENRLCLG